MVDILDNKYRGPRRRRTSEPRDCIPEFMRLNVIEVLSPTNIDQIQIAIYFERIRSKSLRISGELSTTALLLKTLCGSSTMPAPKLQPQRSTTSRIDSSPFLRRQAVVRQGPPVQGGLLRLEAASGQPASRAHHSNGSAKSQLAVATGPSSGGSGAPQAVVIPCLVGGVKGDL
jgi:hypothetical protein